MSDLAHYNMIYFEKKFYKFYIIYKYELHSKVSVDPNSDKIKSLKNEIAFQIFQNFQKYQNLQKMVIFKNIKTQKYLIL